MGTQTVLMDQPILWAKTQHIWAKTQTKCLEDAALIPAALFSPLSPLEAVSFPLLHAKSANATIKPLLAKPKPAKVAASQ